MADDGRKMIFPVTWAQEIKYFPFKFHWKHMPRFKEMFYAFVLLLPAAYWVEKLSKSPANIKKYEAYLEKEKREREEHMLHLEGYYEHQHKH